MSNSFSTRELGILSSGSNIIVDIDVTDEILPSSKKIPTSDAVAQYLAKDDYTAFEVFPTSAVISAGTKSDVVMVGYPYSNGDTYNVGDIVLMPS